MQLLKIIFIDLITAAINVDTRFEMQSNRDQTHPTVCVYYARYIAAHYQY